MTPPFPVPTRTSKAVQETSQKVIEGELVHDVVSESMHDSQRSQSTCGEPRGVRDSGLGGPPDNVRPGPSRGTFVST